MTMQFTLSRTSFYTHQPCLVCGGATEKDDIVCTDGNGHFICTRCLRDGGFDSKLAAHADRHERTAAALRALVGNIEAPSHADWIAASRRAVNEIAIAEGEPPLSEDSPYPYTDKRWWDDTLTSAQIEAAMAAERPRAARGNDQDDMPF
jgi:hypothetical protein